MNWELFTAFLLITAVLVVTPGPIVTLVIATGASQGIRAALTTVAGTTLGNAILLAAIAFGLSWVLKNAAILFDILRWVGAAYLIWLGIRRGVTPAPTAPPPLRAGTCISGAALWSRCPTLNPLRSSRPSCRSSSIRACPPGDSSR